MMQCSSILTHLRNTLQQIYLSFVVSHLFFFYTVQCSNIRDKVFKNGPSKIRGNRPEFVGSRPYHFKAVHSWIFPWVKNKNISTLAENYWFILKNCAWHLQQWYPHSSSVVFVDTNTWSRKKLKHDQQQLLFKTICNTWKNIFHF